MQVRETKLESANDFYCLECFTKKGGAGFKTILKVRGGSRTKFKGGEYFLTFGIRGDSKHQYFQYYLGLKLTSIQSMYLYSS